MTLEELEIVVKANVKDATSKLEGLKAQMDGTQGGFEQIAQESEKVAETVEKSSVEFQKLSTTLMQVGKIILKVLPFILAFIVAIKSISVIIKGLKTTFQTSFKILKGIGIAILSGTAKALQNIGRIASNLINILSNLATKGIKNLVQASTSLNKSMSEIYGRVIQLGNALATTVAPIIRAIEPLISSLLDSMIALANFMAQVTASLFGNATTFKKATKVTTDYAGAVGKANNQLAKFDELNVLSDNSKGGVMTPPQDMFENVEINKDILDWADKIKEKFEEIKKLFRKGDFFGAGDLFGKLFNNEINKISAYDIGQGIAKKINEAMLLINGFLSNNPLGSIGAKLGEFIKGWIEEINPEYIGFFLANVINNAVAFVNGFLDQKPFDNLGTKIADMLLTMVSTIDGQELGRAIANVIMTAVDVLKDFVERMNNEDGWQKVGQWIADSLNSMIENLNPEDMADAISGFITGLLDTALAFFENADWDMITDKIYDTIAGISWGEIIVKVVELIFKIWKLKLSVTWAILSGIATDIFDWITTAVKESIISAVRSVFNSLFTVIDDNGVDVLDKLSMVWLDVTHWWNGIMEQLKSGHFADAIKDVVNSIGEILERGVNAIIFQLNKLSWEVPDWVPVIGGQKFGFNSKYIDIPKLANGGVLDKPTTILAGEYAGASTNPEIVAPQQLLLETSTQANIPVMNSIEEMGDRLVSALNNIGVYAEFDYSKLKVGLDNENYRVGGKLYGI